LFSFHVCERDVVGVFHVGVVDGEGDVSDCCGVDSAVDEGCVCEGEGDVRLVAWVWDGRGDIDEDSFAVDEGVVCLGVS